MLKNKLLKVLKGKEERAEQWASQYEEGSPERQRHLLEAFAYNEAVRLIESPNYLNEMIKFF